MERICIVDDDEAVRDSLGVFLEACGYTVVGFASALAFLTAGDTATYLCLLVDMHMPGMTGLELVEMLRSRGIETPAILITAAADPVLRAQTEKISSFTFLDKPVDGDKLLDAIAAAGERQTD